MFKSALLILSVIFISVSFIGCTKKADETENSYNFTIKSNVKGIDPVQSSDLYSGWVTGQIYEGLMEYHYLKRPYQVIPALSDGMPEISKDNLTYTFKIKKGVRFQDDPCFKATGGKGREVVAGDFIWSWKRLADPANKSESYWIFDGKIKGLDQWRDLAGKSGKADFNAGIEGLQAPDNNTLVVKLVRPFPQFLYVLAMQASAVMPKEALDAYGAEILNHPVGTGPFMLKDWVRNSRVVLVRNPNHRPDFYPSEGEPGDKEAGLLDDAGKQLPLVDKVVFTEQNEDQPRWLLFAQGHSDATEIPKDNYDSAIKNKELAPDLSAKGMKLQKVADMDVTYYAFNMEDPTFGGYSEKKKLLRAAISLAISGKEYGDKFFPNHYILAHQPIPPGLNGYDPNYVNPYVGPNIEKAKELIAKAGYPEGKGLPPLTYEAYAGSTARQGAELFKANAERIGVKVNINMSTWPEFNQKIHKRQAQLWGIAWTADYPDAENFLQLLYGKNAAPGPNGANYRNPEYDKLYEKASVMQDSPERTALYKKMVQVVNADVPWIYNLHRELYYISQGWLKNWKPACEIMISRPKFLRIDMNQRTELRKKF